MEPILHAVCIHRQAGQLFPYHTHIPCCPSLHARSNWTSWQHMKKVHPPVTASSKMRPSRLFTVAPQERGSQRVFQNLDTCSTHSQHQLKIIRNVHHLPRLWQQPTRRQKDTETHERHKRDGQTFNGHGHPDIRREDR